MSKIKEFDQSMVAELSKIHAVKNEYDLFAELKKAQFEYDYFSSFMPNSLTPHKNKAKKVIEKSKDLIKSIDKFQDEILGLDKISNEYLILINLFGCNDQDFKKIRSGANRALEQAQEFLSRQAPTKQGPKSDFSLESLINNLMDIYSESTGNDIGLSKKSDTTEYTGPMLRFINDCLNLMIIHNQSTNSIANIINKQRKKI